MFNKERGRLFEKKTNARLKSTHHGTKTQKIPFRLLPLKVSKQVEPGQCQRNQTDSPPILAWTIPGEDGDREGKRQRVQQKLDVVGYVTEIFVPSLS